MDKKFTRRQVIGSAAAGLLFTLSPAAFAAAPPQFVAVRIWPASAYTRITLEASEKIDYNYFTLDNPRRVVIDIKNARLNQVLQTINSKVQRDDPYIANIRVGQYQSSTVRVVIDLKAPVRPQIFPIAPIANFQHRLVIDLYPLAVQDTSDPLMALLADYSQGKINQQGTVQGSSSYTPPKQTAPPETPKQTTPPAPPKTAPEPEKESWFDRWRGKRSGGQQRQAIVVLDPGHGGEDPGAISAGGLREKDVVLSIARETKKRLEDMGYKVYMTRNEDVFIPLSVRVAKARQLRADVFVSIHADAFTNPSARGTGVYMLSTRGASSAAAKFLEQTQNSADLIGGVKSVGDKVVDSAILDMTQSVTNKDSQILAAKVLQELGRHNKLHKGTVDQANFVVLRAPDIPSILVETAFLSNPTEAKLLASTDFRRKCADAIAKGVKAYLANAVLARH